MLQTSLIILVRSDVILHIAHLIETVFSYLEIPGSVVIWYAPFWGFPGGTVVKNPPAVQEA